MQSEQSERLTESLAADGISLPVHVPRWRVIAHAGTRVAYSVAGLFIFILAMQLLKSGARGLKPVLTEFHAHGVINLMGFGWLGAYTVMSGSPVAAISLSLYSSGTTSDVESFAMINGSRLGASFIVLFVGFILWVTRKKSADGLYIGVVALLTAFTLWLPVLPIGVLILHEGWFDSIRMGSPGPITSLVNVVYDPIVNRIADNVPTIVVFGVGIAILLSAFAVFDRALPNLESTQGSNFERWRDRFHKPLAMFLIGLCITAITLSVSISLTLLIPLSLKGYIRRNAIIPYVMGANISTWVDTLVAALLLNAPRAFTIVFTEMVVGASISLFVLIFLYKPYSAVIIGLANRITHSKRSFALFLGTIMIVPLVLFLV
jgi:solute carrier family 34 (sodium-dependent phosphate cotransporter)